MRSLFTIRYAGLRVALCGPRIDGCNLLHGMHASTGAAVCVTSRVAEGYSRRCSAAETFSQRLHREAPAAATHRQNGGCLRGSHVVRARRSSALQQLQELELESEIAKEDAKLPLAESLEYSVPLEVLQYPHPKLRAQNARVGVFGEKLQQLADLMFDTMYRDDGVGLAAPQVGVNVRLMVFNPTGTRGEGQELVLANPHIITSSRKQDVMEEGCLSFFKLGSKDLILADVQRSLKIKVEAQDVNGQKFQRTFTDWTARIFQHEYDHLQGVLFPDRLSKQARRDALPHLRALEEDFLKRHPEVSIDRYKG